MINFFKKKSQIENEKKTLIILYAFFQKKILKNFTRKKGEKPLIYYLK
jgi:hypothetical protein